MTPLSHKKILAWGAACALSATLVWLWNGAWLDPSYWGYAPREGDVVFQSLPHGALVDAIEGVSRSPFSHCGVVTLRDGEWMVAEALGTVHETPLRAWIARGRGRYFEAWRMPGLDAEKTAKLRAALATFSGRPYDFRYAPDDDKIYCSELAAKAYRAALGVELATWQKIGDLNWRPYETFIRKMEGGGLPLDREMVTPVALTRGGKLEKVAP